MIAAAGGGEHCCCSAIKARQGKARQGKAIKKSLTRSEFLMPKASIAAAKRSYKHPKASA
jgi:hypothetical protein